MAQESRPNLMHKVGVLILMASFGLEGFAHHENAPQGQTVNQHFYLEVLRCLEDAVCCNCPRQWPSGVCVWTIHCDNTLVHLAQSVQQCLTRHCNLCSIVWPDTAICAALFGQTLQSMQHCLARHCNLCSGVWPDTAICAALFGQTLQSVQHCLARHCNLCSSVWPDTAICAALFGQTLQSVQHCLARHCNLCSSVWPDTAICAAVFGQTL